MTIEPGQTLLHYRIEEKIGEGGMGSVWRAIDTTLDRPVAIKFLPQEFTADAERVARFELEAKTVAGLNHPNIAAIYSVHEVEGLRFLAMELVAGESLAERVARGPLPIDEALTIAAQIATALETAHRSGVIHRDLKPANVQLTPEGQAKVLDFGLAKAVAPSMASGDPAASPTLTSLRTEVGTILGTAAYMSPEQAKGRPLDGRADVWAYGCVLFEMLSGKRTWEGETVSETLARVLEREADWQELPQETPPSIRRLVRRCLAKDQSRRLRDLGDALLDIEAVRDGSEAGDAVGASNVAQPSWTKLVPWVAIGLAAVAALVFALRPEAEPARVEARSLRYSLTLPAEMPLAPPGVMPFGVLRPTLDLSPDGDRLAYVGAEGRTHRLYLRDMETGKVKPVPRTEGAMNPFFSPDGRSIGFFQNEKLVKVSTSGGAPDILADAVFPYGAAWHTDGFIYYKPLDSSGIMRVEASGGKPEEVTVPSANDEHRWPSLLPGGKLLFGQEDGGIAVIDLATKEVRELDLATAWYARYVEGGYLLFTGSNRLSVVRFDPETLEIRGEPAVILNDVRTAAFAMADFVLTPDESLVYVQGVDTQEGILAWVDRHGNTEQLDLALRRYGAFAISPDGRRLALPITDAMSEQIWLYDFDRLDSPTRFTFEGNASQPAWSPDGKSLVYAYSQASEEGNLLVQPVDSADREGMPVFAGTTDAAFGPWVTRDGRELLFGLQSAATSLDIWRVPLPDGRLTELEAAGAEPLMNTASTEVFPRVSPDGKWVAYSTDETGRWEVYLAAYPSLENRVRVSANGGEEVRWSEDGRELVYRWGSRWWIAEVSYEPQLSVTQPRVLFEGSFINVAGYSWDMTPDAQRFLVIEGVEQERRVTELVVITNFVDEIERRLQ
jgi:serine/threonine-protein kinase